MKLLNLAVLTLTMLMLTSCAAQMGFKGPRITMDGPQFDASTKLGPQSMLQD